MWQFVKLCQDVGIKPIAGVEVRNQDKFLYILIAANNKGLAWIHSFLSEHLMEKKPFQEATAKPDFFENSADGFVIYPLLAKPLSELLPNEKIGVLPWEVNKLIASD